jgi:hypothetical protein
VGRSFRARSIETRHRQLLSEKVSARLARKLRVALLIVQKMPVGIERELDVLVPDPDLQALQFDVVGDPAARRRVPQLARPEDNMTEATRIIALSRMLSAIEHRARLLRHNYIILRMLENVRAELGDLLDRERSE